MSQQAPFFHADSGTVRFWTLIGDDWVGASISKETLHYVFNRDKSDDQPLPTIWPMLRRSKRPCAAESPVARISR